MSQRIRERPESRDTFFYSAYVLRATMNGDVLHKESIASHYSNIDAVDKSHIIYGFTATCRGSQPLQHERALESQSPPTHSLQVWHLPSLSPTFQEAPQAQTAPAQADSRPQGALFVSVLLLSRNSAIIAFDKGNVNFRSDTVHGATRKAVHHRLSYLNHF